MKTFPEWEWIVGTGVYVDNVNAEIRRVVVPIVIVIAVMVVALGVVTFTVVSRTHIPPDSADCGHAERHLPRRGRPYQKA